MLPYVSPYVSPYKAKSQHLASENSHNMAKVNNPYPLATNSPTKAHASIYKVLTAMNTTFAPGINMANMARTYTSTSIGNHGAGSTRTGSVSLHRGVSVNNNTPLYPEMRMNSMPQSYNSSRVINNSSGTRRSGSASSSVYTPDPNNPTCFRLGMSMTEIIQQYNSTKVGKNGTGTSCTASVPAQHSASLMSATFTPDMINMVQSYSSSRVSNDGPGTSRTASALAQHSAPHTTSTTSTTFTPGMTNMARPTYPPYLYGNNGQSSIAASLAPAPVYTKPAIAKNTRSTQGTNMNHKAEVYRSYPLGNHGAVSANTASFSVYKDEAVATRIGVAPVANMTGTVNTYYPSPPLSNNITTRTAPASAYKDAALVSTYLSTQGANIAGTTKSHTPPPATTNHTTPSTTPTSLPAEKSLDKDATPAIDAIDATDDEEEIIDPNAPIYIYNPLEYKMCVDAIYPEEILDITNSTLQSINKAPAKTQVRIEQNAVTARNRCWVEGKSFSTYVSLRSEY